MNKPILFSLGKILYIAIPESRKRPWKEQGVGSIVESITEELKGELKGTESKEGQGWKSENFSKLAGKRA